METPKSVHSKNETRGSGIDPNVFSCVQGGLISCISRNVYIPEFDLKTNHINAEKLK